MSPGLKIYPGDLGKTVHVNESNFSLMVLLKLEKPLLVKRLQLEKEGSYFTISLNVFCMLKVALSMSFPPVQFHVHFLACWVCVCVLNVMRFVIWS